MKKIDTSEEVWVNLDTAEAAEWMRVSKSTLAKWRVNGGGPIYATMGRKVIYRLKDLKAYQEAHTFRNTSDYEAVLGGEI